MADVTTNLSLPRKFLGIVPFRNSIARAFDLIDAALGDVAAVEVLASEGGAPVDGDLAAKLTAMEARLVALETAVA